MRENVNFLKSPCLIAAKHTRALSNSRITNMDSGRIEAFTNARSTMKTFDVLLSVIEMRSLNFT